MENDSKKRRITGAVFTLAMVGCCLLLYFLPERTKETSDAAAQVTPEPAIVYPAVEVFFERAKKYGLACDLPKNRESEPACALNREGLADAELTFSLSDGGVRAFTLTVPCIAEPEPEGDSEVAVSLYEQRLAIYELEREWLEPNLFALIGALDIMNELTYADKNGMLSIAQKTMADGKGRDVDAGNLVFRSDAISRANGTYAALSLEIES